MYADELPVAWTGPVERPRRCDLGYLRQAYVQADGELGYRCPGEMLESYVRKGGAPEDTVGRQCLCNGLLATIGLAQVRPEGLEPPMITSGEDLSFLPHLVRDGALSYHVRDVLAYLLGERSIVRGIQENVVEEAFKKKQTGQEILIAEGCPPQYGQDGKVEYTFDITSLNHSPKEMAGGKVSLEDINMYVYIAEGKTAVKSQIALR